MALMTVGRMTSQDSALKLAANEEKDVERKKQLEEARKSLLEQLTPWIPGDFVITYGILLTAWTKVRNDFESLLLCSVGLAFGFVFLSAFAATGFTTARSRQWRKLTARSVVGAVVSLIAAIAIPNSGWYDFKAFSENELAWVVTASALVVFVIFFLKGLQKRYKWELSS